MRLLVVEDYGPLRDSLQRGLSRAGYAVDATGDGEEGLWYAEREDYDLLILDIMLPGIDGLEILRRVRAKGHNVPVLILSARDQVDDQVAGLDGGADDYLTKPFAVPELMARVRALLRRRSGQANPVIEVGSVVVDTNARAVRCGTETVALTPREYALLEYLARHLGAVISRQELWDHLYDFAAEASSNTLDQWVARARRKLRALGAESIIETVHGHGYRMVAP
jgi:DNA-binding response OmpR family regulator